MIFKKRGFTLVEMLIVIVIIGLLSAALIPRIVGMQAKARDTSRAGNLREIKTAFVSFESDFGKYPATGSNKVADLGANFEKYLGGNVPKDPQGTRSFSGLATQVDGGSYGYEIITRDGIASGSFVVMAGTEEIGGNTNRVSMFNIQRTTDVKLVRDNLCRRVIRGSANATGETECTALGDNMRHIVTD